MDEKHVMPENEDTDFMLEMTNVMKNIYSSCDLEGTNRVKVSNLINYIRPYMQEDLLALECLENDLDPTNEDIYVSSELFYDVMNKWAKKISSSEDEDQFNRTPSQLDYLDVKELPYNQSTPRASFGQKLLNHSMGLLNMSNVSTYSLNGNKTEVPEVAVLEDKIKMLEFEVHKYKGELSLVRQHLAHSEEQNELLQSDNERINKRYHAEQLSNENLQRENKEFDELRDELSNARKRIEDLLKKNGNSEKQNEKLLNKIEQGENERVALEKKYEEVCRREQHTRKEIFDIKLEVEEKNIEIDNLTKMNDSMRNKLNKQKDLIDFYVSENEQLNYQKLALEKLLKNKRNNRHSADGPNSSTPYDYMRILDSSNSSECNDVTYCSAQNNTSYSSCSDTSFNFHSPELQHKLLNPVSPNFNTPPENNIKLIAHKNNAKATNTPSHNCALLKTVLIKNSSTPVESNISRPILDYSLPNELKDTPVLHPTNTQPNTTDVNFNKPSTHINNSPTLSNDVLDSCLPECQYDSDESIGKLQQLNISITDNVQESLQTEMSNAMLNNNRELEDHEVFLEKIKKYELDIAELVQKASVLENEKEALQTHVEDLEKKKLNAEVSLADLEQQHAKTLQDLAESEKEISNLFIEIDELKTRRQYLEEELDKFKFEKDQCELKIKDIANEKDQLLMQLNRVEELKTDVEKELNVQIEKVKEFENKNEVLCQLKLKIKALDDIICKKEETIEELQTTVKSNNDQYKLILKQLQNESYEKTRRIEKLVKENENIEKKLSGPNDQPNQVVMKNILDTTERVQQLLDKKNADNIELVQLNRKLGSNINKMESDLQVKIKELTELRDLMKEEINTKRSLWLKIKALESTCKNQKDEYSCLLTKHNTCKTELDNLKIQLKTDAESHQVMIKLKEELEKIVSDKKAVILNQEVLMKNLEKKIDCEREKLNKANLNFEVLQKKVDLERKQSEETLKENDKLKRTLSETTFNFRTVETSSNSKKSSSFGKQQLKIEKLVRHLESTEQQLKESKAKEREMIDKYEENNKTLGKELLNIKEQFQMLKVSVSAKEMDITKLKEAEEIFKKQLQEKEEVVRCLKTALDEITIKSEDYTRLMECEEKLKGVRGLLQSSEMELNALKVKVTKAREEFNLVNTQIKHNTGMLAKGRLDMERVTAKVLKTLKSSSEDVFQNNESFKIVYEEVTSNKCPQFSSEAEEEIYKLNRQVKIAIFLLEIIAFKFPKFMDLTDWDDHEIDQISERFSPPEATSKLSRKINLRPSKLILHSPDSPDSPSLDICEHNGEVQCSKNLLNTFNAKKEIKECCDCQNCESLHDDSFTTASDGTGTEQSDFDVSLDSPKVHYEECVPYITDAFLEKLGLHEKSELEKLSPEDTEERFTVLALQFSVDSSDWKERLQRQKDLVKSDEERLLKMISALCSQRGRERLCAKSSTQTVYDVKRQLEKVVCAAAQYGVLSYEGRMMRCWNLVSNYMAILRQNAHSGKSQCTKLDSPTQTVGAAECNLRCRKQRNTSQTNRDVGNQVALLDNGCSSLRKCGLISLGFLAILGIGLFFGSIWHLQCRAIAPDGEGCPLDFLIHKSVNGPSPF